MDDATAEVFATVLTPRRQQDSQCISCDYSRSALDRTHRRCLSPEALYDLPYYKHSNSFVMKNLVGNWLISPIYTYESPEYATVLSGVNSNLNGDSATAIDRAIINPTGNKALGTGVKPSHKFGQGRLSVTTPSMPNRPTMFRPARAHYRTPAATPCRFVRSIMSTSRLSSASPSSTITRLSSEHRLSTSLIMPSTSRVRSTTSTRRATPPAITSRPLPAAPSITRKRYSPITHAPCSSLAKSASKRVQHANGTGFGLSRFLQLDATQRERDFHIALP